MNKTKFWTALPFGIIGVAFLACANPAGIDTSPTRASVTTEPSVTVVSGQPETVSEKNARRKAEQYLSHSSFSRTGLIKQLQFEGFTEIDATYGVDAQSADWNAQAVAKAKSYMNTGTFSKSGLINQLKFEGFTQEQAEHGVSATGL